MFTQRMAVAASFKTDATNHASPVSPLDQSYNNRLQLDLTMQLCRLQARLHCRTAKRWQLIRTFRTHRKWLHVDWTGLRLSHQCKLLKLHKIYQDPKKLNLSTSSTQNTNVITAYSQTVVSHIGFCGGSNNYNTRAVTTRARPTI
jgi:hypothetical protein